MKNHYKKRYEDELCKKFWSNCVFYHNIGRLNIRNIWHNNNGEHSGSKIQRILAGKRAKEMGQQKGLLDYTIVSPNGRHNYLEFKYGNNRLTPEQKFFIEFNQECGNICEVIICKDSQDIISCLKKADQFLKKCNVLT